VKLTDDELLAQLELLERQAVGYYTGEIAQEQGRALDFYYGKPFGTEEEGKSSVVSSDVWDVVEGMTPAILRPFLASDDVVKFTPLGPDDEEAAQQESEYLNWVATQRNDSFTQLVAWVKTGLLQKNGVVKYWWETKQSASIERYSGISDDLMALLAQDADVQIVEHTATVGPAGEPLHDVTLRTVEEVGRAAYCVIPPEEFLVSPDATSPDPQQAPFVQHRRRVTLGQLREMGYDVEDDIDDGTDYDPVLNPQYEARRNEEERIFLRTETADKSLRQVLFKETYWRVDADGDGIPELRKFCCVGRQILSNEETEEIPFVGWTPYPQPFKFYGRCPADETIEVQRVKSTLIRETLNNIYTINNNRTYANEAVNIDDLVDNQLAGVIRVKGNIPVSQAVASAEIQPIGGVIQPMIEYWDSAKENRTGFTRYNQGTDSNSLNKTATGVRIIAENANLRLEIVSRAFGNALAALFRGMHGLCRRHATKAETIRLRGKWVPIDPRQWKKRADLSIAVGLGTADQQMKLQGVQLVLQEQKQLAQVPGLVSPANFYASAAKLAEAVGYKNPEQFFSQPQQQGLPPEVQAQMQAMQQQMQAMQQALQEAQSGLAAKQIDAQVKAADIQSRERIAQLNAMTQERVAEIGADVRRDVAELGGLITVIAKKMDVPVPESLVKEVDEDLSEEEGQEAAEERPDPAVLMAQAVQMLAMPKRKRMRITAPSGQVYEGEIAEGDE
jgi:hypothetical protein